MKKDRTGLIAAQNVNIVLSTRDCLFWGEGVGRETTRKLGRWGITRILCESKKKLFHFKGRQRRKSPRAPGHLAPALRACVKVQYIGVDLHTYYVVSKALIEYI